MQQKESPMAAAELKEVTPGRDGGGELARRLKHHGGVVELRRGGQSKLAPTKALLGHASA